MFMSGLIHVKMDDANIDRMFPPAPTPRSTITMVKVGGLVLALLLVMAGLIMYFCHVKALDAYVVGGYGLVGMLGVAIWSTVDCVREKNSDYKPPAKSKRTREDVKAFAKANPKFKKTGLVITEQEFLDTWSNS